MDILRPAPPARFAATRFILVEPSHPANVGAAARAMKTMGFSQLVLVAPRLPDVHEDPQAIAMASGAGDVLAAARTVASLDAALTGVQWSVALSARPREYGPPQLSPRELAGRAVALTPESSVAMVFGNERVGLSNTDVDRCSVIAHIPANPDYSSLNLAQAVQLIAYELRIAFHGGDVPGAGALAQALASSDEIEGMFSHLEQALVALDFFDPANPKRLLPRLRRLFARTALEQDEVNIVRGIAKAILARVGRGTRDSP